MEQTERDLTRKVLAAHGIRGPVQIARERGADELVILLSPDMAAGINEDRLVRELQNKLHRKVWVVTESDAWRGQTEDL